MYLYVFTCISLLAYRANYPNINQPYTRFMLEFIQLLIYFPFCKFAVSKCSPLTAQVAAVSSVSCAVSGVWRQDVSVLEG